MIFTSTWSILGPVESTTPSDLTTTIAEITSKLSTAETSPVTSHLTTTIEELITILSTTEFSTSGVPTSTQGPEQSTEAGAATGTVIYTLISCPT